MLKFGGLCCGVAGGLAAFLLGTYEASLPWSGSASLWLAAAGLLGIFAGIVVTDASAFAALLMASSAVVVLASAASTGAGVLSTGFVLVAGAALAWGGRARERVARPHRHRRTTPTRRVRNNSLPFGDPAPMFRRLEALMRLAEESRSQRQVLASRRPLRDFRLY